MANRAMSTGVVLGRRSAWPKTSAQVLLAALAFVDAGCDSDSEPAPRVVSLTSAAAPTLVAPAHASASAVERATLPARAPASVKAARCGPSRSGVGHGAAQAPRIAWFVDDFAGAKACAQESKRPLVIDLWAPWCHTCLEMQHTVLTDPELTRLEDRFVWLAADTDKPVNAAMLEKFPTTVWPTFLVVSADDESVHARHLGSASVEQFREFLVDGEHGMTERSSGSLVLEQLKEGDRAAMRSEYAIADKAYVAALEAAGPRWSRRPEVLVSLISVRHHAQAWPGCAELGQASMAETGQGPSAADFAWYAAQCAQKLSDRTLARTLQTAIVARIQSLLIDETSRLTLDDKSAALQLIREVRDALGDKPGARAAAREQRKLLDAAAAAAKSPLAAMTYNWPRAEVYVYLGVPQQLIESLERSVADLPEQYDPPYRLAWIYYKSGKYKLALEMVERALALVYGPRKGRVLELMAEIQKARGRKRAARETLTRALEWYQGLPAGQRQPRSEQSVQQTLQALR